MANHVHRLDAKPTEKKVYSDEHRAKQKAAQAKWREPSAGVLISRYAKEKSLSESDAQKELLLEANQNPEESGQTYDRLDKEHKEFMVSAKEQKAPVTMAAVVPEYPRSPNIADGMPSGHEHVSDKNDFTVIKETDKAYGIANPSYDPQPSGYYGRHRAAKGEVFNNDKYIWLPKSQVTIRSGENGKKEIASLPGWLAERNALNTVEGMEKRRLQAIEDQKHQDKKNDRYEQLITHAKQAGIKGVRSRMRVSSIMDQYKEAGIEPPDYYSLAKCLETGIRILF